jgi:release factor glutamine methyltransferase
MPEVARFEPRLALDGGRDGLDAYRLLAVAGPKLVTSAAISWSRSERGKPLT